METEIIALSKHLSEKMEEANRYRKAVDLGRSFSFQEEIVPFVDDVQARAEEWRSSVQTLLSTRAIGVLHPDQVEHTYENMYVMATDSFQSHMQEQRYQERLQAVAYILNLVLEELEPKER
ncbi:DUF1798 family protein [Salicibibacter halophilus]|uniref:DUF1798 family protein n=1 Tax=Salicibibacter halophilus TaxID=2502791 RepID=A0A514LDR1_9BACI|nr:DUF1798 family protein [Salicibibacter halophilus]QDI89992.1 DUF1798 family protein [Salicibibacter halophilus]